MSKFNIFLFSNIAEDPGIWPVLGNIFQDDFLSRPLGGVIINTQQGKKLSIQCFKIKLDSFKNVFSKTHQKVTHFEYVIENQSPDNLQGLSPDNDIREDEDVFGPPAPPRPPPRPQPKRPPHPPRHHHHPHHQIGPQKPQIFKGRFQNSRKPFKPPNLGLSSSLFRGNAGKYWKEVYVSFSFR